MYVSLHEWIKVSLRCLKQFFALYVCSFSHIKHRDEAVLSSSSVLNYIHLVMSWLSCDLTFILWFVVISSDSTLWRKFKSSQPFSFSHICFVLMTTFWMITGVGCNLNCIQEQLNFEWQQKLAAALLNALSVAFDGNRKCWMQNLNVSLKLSDRLSHVSFWFPTARLCCLRGTQKVSVSVWVWVCLWSIFSNSCPFP